MGERVGESVVVCLDVEVHEAARLVSERLGVELTYRVDADGDPEYRGVRAGVPVCVVLEWSAREPSRLWVYGTECAELLKELDGLPHRLGFTYAGPTAADLERYFTWQRLLTGLRADGWRVEDDELGLYGHLPSGERFELESATLEIGGWTAELPCSPSTPEEFVRVLLELHGRWLTR